jgi:hypothetical protein
MSRAQLNAPAQSAAFLTLLLLLLPAISLALPAGTPPLSPASRAALSDAAGGHAFLPWQRQLMRGLANQPAAPANTARTAGVDGSWSALPPPPLQDAPAVYDPVRESMLVFGGRTSNQGLSNEVWEMSLAGSPNWTLLETFGTKPSPRSGHVLLYDSRRERLLIFGGADSVTLNDSWTLDLTAVPPAWAQSLPTGTPPSPRAYCQAVYDSLNDQLILFGGAETLGADGPPTGMRDDVWSLSSTELPDWMELTPAGTPPSARAAGSVIYDQARQQMVLFGGFDGAVLSDGFTLSLDADPTWTALTATGGPPSDRATSGAIYDAPQDRMVLFGGFGAAGMLNDVWALDLVASEWTELLPPGGPPSGRQFPAAVYDPPGNRMVVFGGSDGRGAVLDPLWALSLGSTVEWTDLGSRRPPQRWLAATTFDATRGVMWIHGGMNWDNTGGTQIRADSWSLPLGSTAGWSEPATTGTPPATRFGHSAVYDAVRDRLVFFGGNGDTLGTTYLNEVWELSLSGTPAWNQISPSGTPPAARMYHSAVYDAVNDRMVVFGGNAGSGALNDVWALSFAGSPAWTQLAPSGTPPPPLWAQSAALDGDANRLIIFGGQFAGRRNNVHALTLTGSPEWTELIPTGTPPSPRQSATMVSLGGHMLVFGGDTEASSGFATNDSWLLSFGSSPAWRQLDVGPVLPPARMASCAAVDPTTLRLAIFGGSAMNSEGGDTWFLQLDQAVPTLASLVSANAGPGRVDLVWEVSSSAASAAVYRRAGDGPWTELGRVTPDGTGRIAYVDRDVIAGSRYGYRLGWSEAGGEVFAGEVWVDVPAGARFALRGMTPNPAPAGAGLIGFSLPDASPARLELVDVSGRQVFSREVGSLGRGEHVVRVSGGQALAPGVYLVRLTQGGRSLTAKVVTVR